MRPHERRKEAMPFLVFAAIALIGAAIHHRREEIGFTNGDGGFQTEVGFADLAIGVLGVLCARSATASCSRR
jgi:hypothetical protein